MWTEAPRAPASRGRRSRNKVSVGEPAEGSFYANAWPGLEEARSSRRSPGPAVRGLLPRRERDPLSVVRGAPLVLPGRRGGGRLALSIIRHRLRISGCVSVRTSTPGCPHPSRGGHFARVQTRGGRAPAACTACCRWAPSRGCRAREGRHGVVAPGQACTERWPASEESQPRFQSNRRGGRLGSGIDEERSQL